MSEQDPAPKLHVDTDWKAEAQAEKERLAAKSAEAAAADKGGADGRGLPEASFRTLVGTLASQAVMGLGAMVDPETKGVVVDLEGARFAIDLLGVMEEKTKGNLDETEASELQQVLSELRARYVQVAQLVSEQMAAGRVGPTGAIAPPAGEPTLEI